MLHAIEPALPSDFLAIAALDRMAWLHTGEPYVADGEHVWRVWCEYATVLVCREHGEPISPALADMCFIKGALVMFWTNARELFLHKIMVHPSLRSQGLGTALMQAALARATAPVLLTVDPENESAVRLYTKFGFRIRHTERGYYRPHERRHVMVYEKAAGNDECRKATVESVKKFQ